MTGKQVLIADDEDNILLVLSIILKKAGFTIILAKNGKQALSKILELKSLGESIDLLITDIQMPVMTGFELIDEIKPSLPDDVPHIFISSLANIGITELKDMLWKELNA